jgi:DNA-binding NarL/FixJ family response regulator
VHASPQHAARAAVLIAPDRHDRDVRGALVDAGFAIESGADAMARVASLLDEQPADLVLLDGRYRGDPVAAAGAVVHRHPETRVVIIAPSEDVESFLEAMRVGVAGYVLADEIGGLPRALWSVMRGEAVVPRRYLPRLVEELRELS